MKWNQKLVLIGCLCVLWTLSIVISPSMAVIDSHPKDEILPTNCTTFIRNGETFGYYSNSSYKNSNNPTGNWNDNYNTLQFLQINPTFQNGQTALYIQIQSPPRNYLLGGAGVLLGGILFMLFGMLSTQVILLFCGFGLIYLGYIVINVIVSAILLDSDRAKNYKIVSNLQLFAQIGSLSSILIYLLLISATNYTIFLYILIAIGIVFLIVAWKYIPPQNQPFRPSPQLATPTASLPADHKRLFTTTILLIVLLCIFTRVNSMASFLFSPWLVTTFGSANFTLYQIVMFVMGVVSIGFLGLVVRWANFIGQHRIHLIIFTGVFFVMNWLVIAWGSFLAILIITSFTTLLEVLLSFSLLTIIIDGTPRTNRTFWYQTYSGVMVGATILFNVLGIVISAASNDTVIYVLIAILIAVNIPILLRLHITKFKETFTVSQSPDSQQ